MKKVVLSRIMAVTIAAAGVSLFVSQNVYAAEESYFDWGDGTIMGVIERIMVFLSTGIGIIAVAGIIYGGIQYSLALGDKAKVAQAIGIIRNCVIALILAAAWGAIMFFIRGGLK